MPLPDSDPPLASGTGAGAPSADRQMVEHLDAMPMSSLHRRVSWSAGLGIFLDGFDISIIAMVLLLLKPHWTLDKPQMAWLGDAALIGALLGATAAGYIADQFGRKAIYLIDILTFLVAAVLCAAAINVYWLIAFRFILGIGVGADYPLSATYLAEFIPSARRGAVMVWVFALWMAGAVVSSLVGVALLKGGPLLAHWLVAGHVGGAWMAKHALSICTWRAMLFAGAIPAIGVVWLRRNLPESPRWYLRRGRATEAAAVLRRLNPALTAAQLSEMINARREQLTKKTRLRVLFEKQYIRRTLLATLPWFLMDIAGYGFGVYLPTIFKALGARDNFRAAIANTIALTVSIVGITLLALTIDRIGRIRPQFWGFVFDTLGLTLLGVWALFETPPMAVVFTGVLTYQIANSFGPGNTTWIIPAELFPTDIRATAHGFATSFSRLGAVLAVFCLPYVAAIGVGWEMLLFAASAALGAILTAALAVEPAQQALPE